MRTRFFIICCSILAMLSMISCQFEISDNGDFDGFWHLTRVDSIASGTSTDLSSRHLFWGVNFDLIRLQDLGDGMASSFFVRFDLTRTTLRLYEFRDATSGSSAGVTQDTLIADPSPLFYYGIYSLDITYNIEKLSNSRMTLSTDSLRLYFVKM